MQGEVVISTDCICDLPHEFVEEFDIQMVYFYVQTEEARFQDTKEITSDNLISYMQKGKSAISSAASYEEYRQFFQKLRKNHPEQAIIHISMARKVSNAYDVASAASKGLDQVYVIDSGNLSGGMGIMVMMATDMAKRGAVCEIILEKLEKLRKQIVCTFVVDSTEMLFKNGRIGSKVNWLCHFLKLHPILKLENSHMSPTFICIGRQKHFARQYLRWALKEKEKIRPSILYLVTAGCTYEFQEFLKNELIQMIPWKTVIVNVASATISCNCGAGSFGIMYLK